MPNNRNEFWTRYYAQLKGRKIIDAGLNADGWPFFKLDDGKVIEVSQDPEGNGPGFLFGLPDPVR
jgi:hypothetical protein